MKFIYQIFLLVLLSTKGITQTKEYYYYYKDQKISLQLDKSNISIISTKSTTIKELTNYIGAHKTSEISENNTEKKAISKYQSKSAYQINNFFSKIGFQNELTEKEYFKKIQNCNTYNDAVLLASPSFKTSEGESIGLTNHIYIKLKSESDFDILEKSCYKYGIEIVGNDKYMPLWYYLKVNKNNASNTLDLANLLKESKFFEYCEPELVSSIKRQSNDPLFQHQWGLKNTRTGTEGNDINVERAWQISKGEGINVAVFDDGIEKEHYDLQPNMHPFSYDAQTNDFVHRVYGNHGTLCAGVIGAVQDNQLYMTGVAPKSKIRSMSMNPQNVTPQMIASGFNTARFNDVDIISNSWSYGIRSSMIDYAISSALSFGRNEKGLVIVFASGNENNSAIGYPANVDRRIIVVGAMAPCGERVSTASCSIAREWGSNYGLELDVVAPGADILTTSVGNNVAFSSGTSLACPIVAGVAALILSKNPSLTSDEVSRIIRLSARKIRPDLYSYSNFSSNEPGQTNFEMGCGLVDAYTALLNTPVNCTNPLPATFTQIAPVCQGSNVILPTLSTDGIRGTWSPEFNSDVTTTYTFTPENGQCANLTTMNVEIITVGKALFTQVAPICKGDTIDALPTTSTNGITGSWSPALNNTETTTYFFTPNNGGCSSTMTIQVNPPIVPTFTQVAPICQSETLTALPTTSLNGITGTWSPAINNNATTTYTFTPSSGQCASSTTMTIVVNPLLVPEFTQVTPKCQNATIAPLPTVSNNGIRGTWSPALNNTATTTYTFTPASGQCVSSTSLTTMTIEILPVIRPVFDQINPVCQGTSMVLPTTSTNGISGYWTPSFNSNATTTYTFIPNGTQCASNTTMNIQVIPKIIPTFSQVAPVCQGSSLVPLPTTSINGIRGTWSPALNNMTTTTYTFTPENGQCASNASLTIQVNNPVKPTFSQVVPICQGSALVALPTTSNNRISGSWSPAINNTTTTTYTFTPVSGSCATITTMTIQVLSLVKPTFVQVAPICQGTILAALPTTSTNGVTGTWSPALNNTATTTYTFTPSNGQCALSTTMTIEVTPRVKPTFTQVPPICLGGTLLPLPTISTNGIRGTWSPAINANATTTYTFTPATGQCASTVSMTISVWANGTPYCNSLATCSNGVNLSSPETNYLALYRSLSKIETSTNYTIDSGKEVYFKSQNAIYLKPNTRIVAGAKFIAKIESCPQTTFAKENEVVEDKLDEEKIKIENAVTLYPIPAKSRITIASSDVNIKIIKVFSLEGKMLVEKTCNELMIDLDVSNYKSGIYFVEIQIKNGQTIRKKFSKE